MPTQHTHFLARCRGVILHEGRLLVVRHAHDLSFAVLPGGHLEQGEEVPECLERELFEELGVKAELGRLLFVHTFFDEEGVQILEFLMEVINGSDFMHTRVAEASHGYEIAAMEWLKPGSDVRLRPEVIAEHFRRGTLLSDRVRFITQTLAVRAPGMR